MPPPMPPRRPQGPPRPTRLRDYPRWIVRMVRSFLSHLFYIVRLVYEAQPWMLLLMGIFCLLGGVLPVLGAWITRDLLNAVADMLDGGFASGSFADFVREELLGRFRAVTFLILFQFLYQFASRLISRLSTLTNNLAGELCANHIKEKIMTQARSVDMSSFDRPEFYEKLENANREAGMRPLMILRATFDLVSAVISAVSFVLIIGSLHPLAPLFIVVVAMPTAVVNCVYRNKSFFYMRHRSKERRQMQYFSNQLVDKDKAKEVRIMGLSDTFIDRYRHAFRIYFRGIRSLSLRETFWQMAAALVSLAGSALLLVYVVYGVVSGSGEIGDWSLYSGALASITAAVGTVIASVASIYEGTLFIDNMMVFMRERPAIVPSVTPPRRPSEGPHTIEFSHVSFAYPGGRGNVISDVSFTLRTGETMVLVGLNGAGKTTLIKLLTRLYDPTEGVILLDGHDLREYDVAALYDLFGVIFQDFGRYAVTARENVTFGDVGRDPAEGEVETAAKNSGADDYVRELPLGYDTPLQRFFEEDGAELSGGQWQKLAIARAFYKRSAILILDEPTASLDPLAEAAVFDRFAGEGDDKITILVSHRLSGATSAKVIAVLEGGRLIECGTHAELMAKKERYHELFTVQARNYVENSPPPDRREAPHPLPDEDIGLGEENE
ncbi:MAG: ABC transporter ATP-binding protein [Clostridia bacterium]|nr:ABC transporter ATP-binding protein [Clostridia bacterium]